MYIFITHIYFTITSNKLPAVKITTGRWKKIIPKIPKFSSPSLSRLYLSKIPLKPQIGGAV